MKVIKILAAITAAAALVMFFTSDAFADETVYKLESATIVWPDGNISSSRAGHFYADGVAWRSPAGSESYVRVCVGNDCQTAHSIIRDYWTEANGEVIHYIDSNGVERKSSIIHAMPYTIMGGYNGATEVDVWRVVPMPDSRTARSAVAKSATVGEKTPTSVVEALTLLGAN